MHNSTKLATILVVSLIGAAALPTGSAEVNTSAVVGNVVPVVTDISVPVTVNPTAGTTTAVPITINVADNNGYQDLASVTVTVLKPDGTTVHVAEAAATSNADGSGTSQTYAYTFDMQFHDDPAIGADYYHVRAVAEDAANGVSVPVVVDFQYSELVALSLSTSALGFGELEPGQRSATQTLGVTNKGNVQIDIQTSGTDLSDGKGHSIDQTNVKYDLGTSDFSSQSNLTDAAYINGGFDLAKGASSSRDSFWALDVPSAAAQYLPSGAYTGTITVSAIQG